MYKLALVIFLTVCCLSNSTAQYTEKPLSEKNNPLSYAYIRVEGKFLSKKLKVNVDLGDSEAEIKEGDRLSDILTNKKSYAAILNYMSELGYELVNTLDLTSNANGSGGTYGIVYVMKKQIVLR